MEKNYAVGIDIGAQSAKIGIVDNIGNVVVQTAIVSNDTDDEHLFIQNLAAAVKKLVPADIKAEQICGVGIGAPNANYHTGTIELAPNLTWAKGKRIDFAKLFTEQTKLPCALTNDANAAAVGEERYGAAKGLKDFIEITLGSGVGSGIFIDGKVLYGHDGFAGELGHVGIVRYNGRPCGCGKHGCLEAYASAFGMARTAREYLEANFDLKLDKKESALRKLITISSKDVYDAAVLGDKLAIEVFNFTGRILGRALADFVAFSAPEAIILFGGVMKSGDLLLKPITEAFEENLLQIWKGKIKILTSGLEESDAAILGASALAWGLT
jgi:glucokinase